MINIYKKRIIENKFNTYFLCVGDKDYNIKKEVIIPSNSSCNCYSIAKAFTVLALGMLYDKGLLSMDMYIIDILKKYIPNDIDERWNKVTIEDAILHKVGFNKGLLDIDIEDASKYHSFDYLDIIFKTKLVYEPGEVYQYTDASYYLLSRVVSEVSGMDLLDFLRPVLMKKMKFKELAWSKCPNGYSMGATGLYLRTEDMIKLGILFLNKGKWLEERIVSNEWIDKVILNEFEFKYIENGWYIKGGMRGQLLMFNFKLNKVISCHSYDDNISYKIFIN
jgi:CubicO group peptidase (beta-lactamase class C family)